MGLNPHRSARPSPGRDSLFAVEADAALAGFATFRDDLEKKVRAGDLTVKAARQQAKSATDRLRADLLSRALGHQPVPRVFLDRLVEVSQHRARAKENASIESLQRETNRLLRQGLVERQIETRASEFEGRAFVRPMAGGPPSPTLDSLLRFHDEATQGGDESAREWARRQLDAMRPRLVDSDDVRRVDLACDRPDRINPGLIARYVQGMHGADALALETFVAEAVGGRDANACAAAFLMAREAPEGASLRWVRSTLAGVSDFPDSALAALRAWEAESRRAETSAARAVAEEAIARAESQARLSGLEPPTAAELQRQVRVDSAPPAGPGLPIGLTLDRRGLNPDEFAEMAES